jgi:hypothetical protein
MFCVLVRVDREEHRIRIVKMVIRAAHWEGGRGGGLYCLLLSQQSSLYYLKAAAPVFYSEPPVHRRLRAGTGKYTGDRRPGGSRRILAPGE